MKIKGMSSTVLGTLVSIILLLTVSGIGIKMYHNVKQGTKASDESLRYLQASANTMGLVVACDNYISNAQIYGYNQKLLQITGLEKYLASFPKLKEYCNGEDKPSKCAALCEKILLINSKCKNCGNPGICLVDSLDLFSKCLTNAEGKTYEGWLPSNPTLEFLAFSSCNLQSCIYKNVVGYSFAPYGSCAYGYGIKNENEMSTEDEQNWFVCVKKDAVVDSKGFPLISKINLNNKILDFDANKKCLNLQGYQKCVVKLSSADEMSKEGYVCDTPTDFCNKKCKETCETGDSAFCSNCKDVILKSEWLEKPCKKLCEAYFVESNDIKECTYKCRENSLECFYGNEKACGIKDIQTMQISIAEKPFSFSKDCIDTYCKVEYCFPSSTFELDDDRETIQKELELCLPDYDFSKNMQGIWVNTYDEISSNYFKDFGKNLCICKAFHSTLFSGPSPWSNNLWENDQDDDEKENSKHCCGDNENEHLIWRRGALSNISDTACCNDKDSCVLFGKCYNNGETINLEEINSEYAKEIKKIYGDTIFECKNTYWYPPSSWIVCNSGKDLNGFEIYDKNKCLIADDLAYYLTDSDFLEGEEITPFVLPRPDLFNSKFVLASESNPKIIWSNSYEITTYNDNIYTKTSSFEIISPVRACIPTVDKGIAKPIIVLPFINFLMPLYSNEKYSKNDLTWDDYLLGPLYMSSEGSYYMFSYSDVDLRGLDFIFLRRFYNTGAKETRQDYDIEHINKYGGEEPFIAPLFFEVKKNVGGEKPLRFTFYYSLNLKSLDIPEEVIKKKSWHDLDCNYRIEFNVSFDANAKDKFSGRTFYIQFPIGNWILDKKLDENANNLIITYYNPTKKDSNINSEYFEDKEDEAYYWFEKDLSKKTEMRDGVPVWIKLPKNVENYDVDKDDNKITLNFRVYFDQNDKCRGEGYDANKVFEFFKNFEGENIDKVCKTSSERKDCNGWVLTGDLKSEPCCSIKDGILKLWQNNPHNKNTDIWYALFKENEDQKPEAFSIVYKATAAFSASNIDPSRWDLDYRFIATTKEDGIERPVAKVSADTNWWSVGNWNQNYMFRVGKKSYKIRDEWLGINKWSYVWINLNYSGILQNPEAIIYLYNEDTNKLTLREFNIKETDKDSFYIDRLGFGIQPMYTTDPLAIDYIGVVRLPEYNKKFIFDFSAIEKQEDLIPHNPNLDRIKKSYFLSKISYEDFSISPISSYKFLNEHFNPFGDIIFDKDLDISNTQTKLKLLRESTEKKHFDYATLTLLKPIGNKLWCDWSDQDTYTDLASCPGTINSQKDLDTSCSLPSFIMVKWDKDNEEYKLKVLQLLPFSKWNGNIENNNIINKYYSIWINSYDTFQYVCSSSSAECIMHGASDAINSIMRFDKPFVLWKRYYSDSGITKDFNFDFHVKLNNYRDIVTIMPTNQYFKFTKSYNDKDYKITNRYVIAIASDSNGNNAIGYFHFYPNGINDLGSIIDSSSDSLIAEFIPIEKISTDEKFYNTYYTDLWLNNKHLLILSFTPKSINEPLGIDESFEVYDITDPKEIRVDKSEKDKIVSQIRKYFNEILKISPEKITSIKPILAIPSISLKYHYDSDGKKVYDIEATTYLVMNVDYLGDDNKIYSELIIMRNDLDSQPWIQELGSLLDEYLNRQNNENKEGE